MIPKAVVRLRTARIAWRFSRGRKRSMPNTVPSDDDRHSPLVMMAKNTYPTIIRPHSKLGVVPKTSQPGGSAMTAAIAAAPMTTMSPASHSRSPSDMLRTSAASAVPAARGRSGTV